MATTTTKLALTKPDGTDLVDIAVLNANADKIDAASGATICTSSTRPASPFNGQVIFETDTLNALVYRLSTTSWNILGGSTVASAPPAGAGNGNFWWDSDNGKLYIYYNDGNSSQWVSVMPAQTAVEVASNVVINGDFSINQRGFSSSTTAGTYSFDRWKIEHSGGATWSAQTFTPGTAPVIGYEAKNFIRCVTSGQSAANTFTILRQAIEDVRTFAGQTVTVSFWAKAASGTPKIALEFEQGFGSGGSSNATSYGGQVAIGTSWARYSVVATVPSVAGKTIGTDAATSSLLVSMWLSAGTDYNARTGSIGIQNNTFDIWGVQIEKGSVATSFKRAGGTLQGELAACQRYYWRYTNVGNNIVIGHGWSNSSSTGYVMLTNPVTMRIAPTVYELGPSVDVSDIASYGIGISTIGASMGKEISQFTIGFANPWAVAGRNLYIRTGAVGSYFAMSAEF